MQFSRGYDKCRVKVEKSAKYTRSCFNCAYYYQEHGDKEEMCQNPSVLEYDMVVEENQIYCVHWKPAYKEETKFKKTGRNKL